MSRADEIFAQNMTDIMENGFWDTELAVRPKWEDGTPAHTVKKFGIVNRYNLQEEFPILTMRNTSAKCPQRACEEKNLTGTIKAVKGIVLISQ